MYFPESDSDWQTCDAQQAGFTAGGLREVLDFCETHNSEQLVILHQGRLLSHTCWNCDAGSMGDVFAVQKGLFAFLIGAAIDRELIDVDQPVNAYLPAGWTRLPSDQEARLTIRHLLTMTTGMSDELEAEGEIGVSWRYNNTAYNYLKRILMERSGLSLQDLTREWLLAPTGMTHSEWIDREQRLPDGRPLTGLVMNALDMARLGLLMLARGQWNGADVVHDRAFLERMLQPGSAANPAWCFLWWRNDQSHYCVPFVDRVFQGAPIPQAPPDLLAAQGAMDNKVYVLPGLELVIARRGGSAFPRGQRGSFDGELFSRLMAARG